MAFNNICSTYWYYTQENYLETKILSRTKWFHYKPKWVKIRNMEISQSKTETEKLHCQGSYPVIGGSIMLNDVSQNSTAINEI